MRVLVLFSALATFGSPALAHHEVVIATSMMPLIGSLCIVLLGIAATFKATIRKRKTERRPFFLWRQ